MSAAPPHASPQASLALLRAALGLFAGIVIVQASLGFAGALAAAPTALAVLGIGAAVLWCLRGGRRAADSPTAGGGASTDDAPSTAPCTTSAAAAGVAAAVGLIVALGERAWTGLHRTTFLYDVMSYHLHLPAAWRAAGRVTLIPTPFGDPAPGYTPANAELIYEAALAAAGNATLAHAGQLPFAALAVLAIHMTARQLGATAGVGLTAGLAFLLVPEVWQQSPTAMADLPMAAFFLSALPFLLRLERGRAWPDVLALGAALGLLLGTKFVSVVLSLPLLAWTAVVLLRWSRGQARHGRGPTTARAAAVLLAAMFACGGFWYLRNAVVAGNPLFPATVGAGGRALLRGIIDGQALRASEYHVPVTELGTLGGLLAEPGWAFCAAVVAAGWLARRSRWPALLAVVIALLWCVVPYQQSRFFFVVWAIGAILVAAGAGRAPRAGAGLLVAATAGSVLQFPTAGRLAVAGAGLVAALVVARLPPTAAAAVRRLDVGAAMRGRAARLACAAACAVFMVATLAWARTRAALPDYAVGDDHDAAWRWMGLQPPGRHVAYTGSNLPLPLWGPRFENVVRYVPIAGTLSSAPHQFLHVAPPAADETPSEPAPERRVPDRAAWLANLDAFAADWLFVARMYHGVARANFRDSGDFPIERVWADALPGRFSLEYATEGARVYRVRRQRAGGTP
jgi:hypothetical protein